MRIVTLEGELLNASGAMTGGTQRKRRSTPPCSAGRSKADQRTHPPEQRGAGGLGQELQELEQQMEEIDNKLEQQNKHL